MTTESKTRRSVGSVTGAYGNGFGTVSEPFRNRFGTVLEHYGAVSGRYGGNRRSG